LSGGPAKRYHIVVSGVVQGVGFRFFTQRLAVRLGLDGYVRNLPNGSVEAVAEGPESSLKIFIDELGLGPPSASVRSLNVDENAPSGDFERFEIRF
jgi:acylphosphatase